MGDASFHQDAALLSQIAGFLSPFLWPNNIFFIHHLLMDICFLVSGLAGSLGWLCLRLWVGLRAVPYGSQGVPFLWQIQRYR